MLKKIESHSDLEVYQKLVELHITVHEMTMNFPKFEMYIAEEELHRNLNERYNECGKMLRGLEQSLERFKP